MTGRVRERAIANLKLTLTLKNIVHWMTKTAQQKLYMHHQIFDVSPKFITGFYFLFYWGPKHAKTFILPSGVNGIKLWPLKELWHLGGEHHQKKELTFLDLILPSDKVINNLVIV